MELSTRQEIAAAPHAVWAELTNFDRFERTARKRGIAVAREGTPEDPEWQIEATVAGAPRSLRLRIDGMDPPNSLTAVGRGSGFATQMTVTLAPIPSGTAMTVALSVRGTSLAGKAIVGGLRVGQSKIQERFEKRVQRLVGDVANRAA